MRVSTRVRYGTRALVDIAEHHGNGPVCLRDIARRQKVSQPYLEQLILLLKAAGLVRSIRGARGGFVLARDPAEISMIEVMTTLGWESEVVDCVGDPGSCSRAGACGMRDFWCRLSDAVSKVVGSTTLADLMQEQAETSNSHCRPGYRRVGC
ncbi:RrF2 family transcriptional regulator [Candidatus Desulforudis audaxviator]|uniref:Transcriptional regulator, BadM/Rrf2 family n=1 Tax=Desulforudis audaxviator (strain MP104C) TaxID=477974 RepID=B1I530_DESAP|nr:RrF2 family transcriptional regulator [Candidatus Desulforudis audaxviator]ACA60059.1 transcriptional regulator, BadM/Rrf2 family [Candidatus Desulforudis audaxviator MP104C]AZK60097.1 transcriptional regulator, BadM/Rrf2 family [Candidatus Desulforudis audaxviator]